MDEDGKEEGATRSEGKNQGQKERPMGHGLVGGRQESEMQGPARPVAAAVVGLASSVCLPHLGRLAVDKIEVVVLSRYLSRCHMTSSLLH